MSLLYTTVKDYSFIYFLIDNTIHCHLIRTRRSAALLDGAQAMIRLAVMWCRTCSIASTRVTVLPVPGIKGPNRYTLARSNDSQTLLFSNSADSHVVDNSKG